jgi:hypothetical protein
MERLQRSMIRHRVSAIQRRFKDGKEHRGWNIVDNKRCAGGKVVQRHVLYLEINDGRREAWCQLIDAFDEGSRRHRQLALFAADREVPACGEDHGVQGVTNCVGRGSGARVFGMSAV